MIEHVDTSVKDLIRDGVVLHETLAVLNSWLRVNRKCIVGYYPPHWCSVMAISENKTTKKLFSHVSLAACIEFALKYEG